MSESDNKELTEWIERGFKKLDDKKKSEFIQGGQTMLRAGFEIKKVKKHLKFLYSLTNGEKL